MKALAAVLALVVAVLAVLFFSARQAAQKQIADAQAEAVAKGNEVVAAQQQLADAHAQLTQLQQGAVEERARTEQLLGTLTNQLVAAQTEAQAKQTRIDELEKKGGALESEIDVVTRQLMDVDAKLAQLETVHEGTVENLKAMREDYVRLSKEKTVLEAKLHNLKALKEQIRVVKEELRAQRIAESQRIERAQTALGNGGFVMKGGTWISVPKGPAGKFPLTQEIGRDPAAPAPSSP